VTEPARDEREFTPHAEAGWESWDKWSPERDFCTWVGWMQRILRPAVVLETGVGVGRLTGHLDLDACDYLGFEADPAWRSPPADPDQQSPTAAQMASADLVILDSDPTFRVPELKMWSADGKPGSVCIVHDCGNNHPPGWRTHHRLRAAVLETQLPGIFTRNPRGGWLGWHP
jgi:hypothetical protein